MDKETGKIGDNEVQNGHGNFSDERASYGRTYKRVNGFQRYENSLKNHIPVRRKQKQRNNTTTIDSAGLLSMISFSWMSKIMYKAHKKEITMEELLELSQFDAGTYNVGRLELLWEDELRRKGPGKVSFLKVAWIFCRTRVIASCFVVVCNLISGFLSYTYLMRKLLESVQSGTGTYEEGLKWAFLLIAAELSRMFFMNWSWSLNYRTAARLRSACVTLIYRKIIRVDNFGSQNIGKVINVFSNDAQTIYELLLIGPMIIGAPISTIFGVFYILWLLGPMALFGMLAFLLFYPIQYMLSRLTGYLQNKMVKITDKRVRLMNEILDCIKLIKMYAWEDRFGKDLLDLRETERRLLLKTSYCQSFSSSLAPAMPVISAIITFLAHVSVGNNLKASQVFPFTTFLHSGLRLPLLFFQTSIYHMISARISFDRIKSLLLLQDGNCIVTKPILKSHALTITNGTFGYNTLGDDKLKSSQAEDNKRNGTSVTAGEKAEIMKLNEPTNNAEQIDVLFDVSFEAEKGKLVGICGQVGSGKSSLLLAALGQLRVSKGQVARDGSCAYVSQQAWITNATLRENVLFGESFDPDRYQKAIYACNLIQDINMMPAGDRTEIGEKGVNLSGGQKQRVALARALYADREIYFLDDPLSAVDSRVGSYIFDNLILGALKGKTVLFVTHQIQYLNRCDDIYMMRDGRIIERGTHDELMKLGNDYPLMIAAISSDTEPATETILDQPVEALPKSVDDVPLHEADPNHADGIGSHASEKIAKESSAPDAQLIVAENFQQGSIKAHTFHSYVVAAGGYFSILLVMLTFLATATSIAFSSWWLAYWIEAGGGNSRITMNNETTLSDNINDNPDISYYRSIYASTIGIIILTSIVRSLVYTRTMIRASSQMHNNLFEKIIKSPMRFFDTTPIGRIQQLFSRDMDEVDNRLPNTVMSILQNVMTIILTMLIICLVFPWFILPLSILAVLFYFITKIFRVAIRDIKRLDNKAHAPIISFVTATVQGIGTIHAFGKENYCLARFTKLFDENSRCLYTYTGAIRWLALRIDALVVTVTGVTAFLVIALQDQVSPALAGLALSYSAHISGMLQFTIRLLLETEVRFISVERINHYIGTLRSEGGADKPTLEPPSFTWPTTAEIKFKGVSMAYGDGAPVILKNISFSINGGEKIGIVGRTGSGKSSLTVALFRLVELAEGKIEIDGVDIAKISLSQLRTKLSIIPQDPVLFSGTIRSNLDPFKLYTDAEIWNALERTELKENVQSIAGQLDASVGFGGDNWSLGERQLLCLTRALLRNSKILVLDEATAAVDPETEIAVQKTIQQAFSQCTILTIAHRLQTVLSLDRILVMSDGEVLEFDTPSNLLADPSSELSKMLAAAEKAASK